MLLNLTPLDLITYRAALALRFIDSVTGAAVSDRPAGQGLGVRPGRAAGRPPGGRSRAVAEQRHLRLACAARPGRLPDRRRPCPPASLAFIVHVEDGRGRYLPQTRRYDLPLAQPAVQQVILFPAADRATPTGYATVRGQLLRTSAPAGVPPEVTVVEPARWARVALTVPPGSPGDPPVTFLGQADGRGTVVIMAPYPLLAAGVLLDDASWTVAASVDHQPASQAADYDLLEAGPARACCPMRGTAAFPALSGHPRAQGSAILYGSRHGGRCGRTHLRDCRRNQRSPNWTLTCHLAGP